MRVVKRHELIAVVPLRDVRHRRVANASEAPPQIVVDTDERQQDCAKRSAMRDSHHGLRLIHGCKMIGNLLRTGSVIGIPFAAFPALPSLKEQVQLAGEVLLNLRPGVATPIADVQLPQSRISFQRQRKSLGEGLCSVCCTLQIAGQQRCNRDIRQSARQILCLLASELAQRRVGLPLPSASRVPFALCVPNQIDIACCH